MIIRNYFKLAFGLVVGAVVLNSCVQDDDWDTPPVNCNNKFAAPTKTMAEVAAMAPSSGAYTFDAKDGDIIIDGYVVSSDEFGNFYKTISFQDRPENPSVGLQIEVDRASNYADLPVGSHIRLKLNGLKIAKDRGVIKIGSEDPTYTIGRIPSSLAGRYFSGVCGGNGLEVATIKPLELPSLKAAMSDKYLNMLVSVPDVQFADSVIKPVVQTFAQVNADGSRQDTDRKIEDKAGGNTVIRTSGYASFAARTLPTGSGVATFVVSKYNKNYQMIVRNENDLAFTGERFSGSTTSAPNPTPSPTDSAPPKGSANVTYPSVINETFEGFSPINLEVFTNYINDAVVGNRYWQLKSYNKNQYIQMSANAGTGNYHTYFVVPVNFTPGKKLSFNVNVGYYKGDGLKVYYSTDYKPMGDMTQAKLTDITSSFTLPKAPATGYGTLGSAGSYTTPASLSGNGFIIFKYEGNGSGVTTTYQIDDIKYE
ncbi:DUF5689 domain-containing protein [Cruoricaptor ignavus]|uniref:DUF5689 domain-containing protein n=1 Tax=Cruoricaptor ignavus TaxID=1118202 RepID=UPI00370D81CA